MTKWIETLTGSLEQKRQYKHLRARLDQLPEPYGTTAKALLKYFLYSGGVVSGETSITAMRDHVEMWERAAADGTPVRAIVGDDPVEFAESFMAAYTGERWIDKQRARLTAAIDDVAPLS